MPYERLSKRLREIRQEVGLSQAQLATRLKLAKSTIAQYETLARNPDLETAARWAAECKHTLVVDVLPDDQDWQLHRLVDGLPVGQRQLLMEFLLAASQIDEDRTNTLRVLFNTWRLSASSHDTVENVSKDTKMRALKP